MAWPSLRLPARILSFSRFTAVLTWAGPITDDWAKSNLLIFEKPRSFILIDAVVKAIWLSFSFLLIISGSPSLVSSADFLYLLLKFV